jgi:hypothetical protein
MVGKEQIGYTWDIKARPWLVSLAAEYPPPDNHSNSF